MEDSARKLAYFMSLPDTHNGENKVQPITQMLSPSWSHRELQIYALQDVLVYSSFQLAHRGDPASYERWESRGSKGQLYNTHLTNKVTAPATTGEATLVPESARQPPFTPEPRTPAP